MAACGSPQGLFQVSLVNKTKRIEPFEIQPANEKMRRL